MSGVIKSFSFLSGAAVVGVAIFATTTLAWFYWFKKIDQSQPESPSLNSSKHPKTLIDHNQKYPLPLISKTILTHNTRKFTFALPSPNHVLGLNPGQHIYLSAKINGQLVVRTYSPVSTDLDVGVMDIIVKIYFKNTNPNFPEGGKMSQYLDSLEPGDIVDVRGPGGSMMYTGPGEFSISTNKKMGTKNVLKAKYINMIAGGSGITPMIQIIKAVLNGSDHELYLSLLFANQTEDDIICRTDLEDLVQQYGSDKFKLWYTLSRPTNGWDYSIGHVNGQMFQTHLYPPTNQTMTLLCGPNSMINSSCLPELKNMGFEDNRIFVY